VLRGIQGGPHKRSDARENPALIGTILMPMELANCLSGGFFRNHDSVGAEHHHKTGQIQSHFDCPLPR
jgi:hypothetical protein